MNKKIIAAVTILVCIYLDSVLFAQVNLYDIRPDAMLAATVSIAVLMGGSFGAVFGGIGGILMDILVGRFLGLSAALYLAAGMASGFFYRKYYADNALIPAAAAAGLGLGKELFLSAVVLLGGAKYTYLTLLTRYILPCAVLTGLLCTLMHLALKPLMLRQIKRSS